jgi:hypothetical protein
MLQLRLRAALEEVVAGEERHRRRQPPAGAQRDRVGARQLALDPLPQRRAPGEIGVGPTGAVVQRRRPERLRRRGRSGPVQ